MVLTLALSFFIESGKRLLPSLVYISETPCEIMEGPEIESRSGLFKFRASDWKSAPTVLGRWSSVKDQTSESVDDDEDFDPDLDSVSESLSEI